MVKIDKIVQLKVIEENYIHSQIIINSIKIMLIIISIIRKLNYKRKIKILKR